MLIAIVILYIILIFPIFLKIEFVFNCEYKKAFFSIRVFGLLKLFSGYIQLSLNKLFIHVSDKKAILIEFVDFDGVKKSFKPFMDYHFITFESKTELGLQENMLIPATVIFLLNYVQSISKWLLINKKHYLNFDNYFYLYEEENKFAFYSNTLIVLNLLMIAISVIKIMMEKVIYGLRKSKQQN